MFAAIFQSFLVWDTMDGAALPTDIAAALSQLDEELAEGDITRKGYLKRRTQLFAATGLSTYLDYNTDNFIDQQVDRNTDNLVKRSISPPQHEHLRFSDEYDRHESDSASYDFPYAENVAVQLPFDNLNVSHVEDRFADEFEAFPARAVSDEAYDSISEQTHDYRERDLLPFNESLANTNNHSAMRPHSGEIYLEHANEIS